MRRLPIGWLVLAAVVTAAPDDRNVFWPTVSPDGKTVVLSYSERDFGVGELHRLDLESGTIRPFLEP